VGRYRLHFLSVPRLPQRPVAQTQALSGGAGA
jgi:hypothetical protein